MALPDFLFYVFDMLWKKVSPPDLDDFPILYDGFTSESSPTIIRRSIHYVRIADNGARNCISRFNSVFFMLLTSIFFSVCTFQKRIQIGDYVRMQIPDAGRRLYY